MNAEDVASFLKCADRHAPVDQCAPRLTPEARLRAIRAGLITMPEQRHENRGRKNVLTPNVVEWAKRERAAGKTMKQIAVALRVSVSALQKKFHQRTTQ